MWVELKFLWLEQMLEVKANWLSSLIFSFGYPLVVIFGIGRIGNGLTDPTSLLYIISGSATLSVMNEAFVNFALNVGTMRREGVLVYYAALPISKFSFVCALLLSRLVISLPGMMVAILIGPRMYGVVYTVNIWILLLFPLTGLSLSAIGMAMGLLIKSYYTLQTSLGALLGVGMFTTPLFIPLSALPLPFQVLSYVFPPTYAADAFRHALVGTFDITFYVDIAVLSLMTVISYYFLEKRLRWRF